MKKLTKILIGSSIVLILLIIAIIFLLEKESIISTTIHDALIIAIIISSVLIFVVIALFLFIVNNKYYNSILYLLLIVVLGHISKFMHWPGWSVILLVGYILSVFGFIVVGIRASKDLKEHSYLKRLSMAINFVLILVFLGILTKILHFPGGQYFITIGSILYILSILALVFTLPNSNFHNWTGFLKKYFFRTIIIPMTYIFLFLSIFYTFPNTFNNLMGWGGQKQIIQWEMFDYELVIDEPTH